MRLKWVRRSRPCSKAAADGPSAWEGGCDALELESFELVPLPEVPQPATELCIAAASLLASIANLPRSVVTATVPLSALTDDVTEDDECAGLPSRVVLAPIPQERLA